MKIGVMFGNPETTPGGQALKFYSSVRMRTSQSAKIQRGEEIIGNRVKVKIVKNKVAPHFREAEFDIIYGEGISYEGDLLNLGLKYELIKKSGASFSFGEVRLGQGFENSRKFLEENPKAASELKKAIIERTK